MDYTLQDEINLFLLPQILVSARDHVIRHMSPWPGHGVGISHPSHNNIQVGMVFIYGRSSGWLLRKCLPFPDSQSLGSRNMEVLWETHRHRNSQNKTRGVFVDVR